MACSLLPKFIMIGTACMSSLRGQKPKISLSFGKYGASRLTLRSQISGKFGMGKRTWCALPYQISLKPLDHVTCLQTETSNFRLVSTSNLTDLGIFNHPVTQRGGRFRHATVHDSVVCSSVLNFRLKLIGAPCRPEGQPQFLTNFEILGAPIRLHRSGQNLADDSKPNKARSSVPSSS